MISRKETFVKHNGQRLPIEIVIQAEPDCEPIEGSFDFGNEADNKQYLARFENGELLSVNITVKALFKGLEGHDHLGACHVTSHLLANDVEQHVIDYGMEKNATDDLLNNLKDLMEAVS